MEIFFNVSFKRTAASSRGWSRWDKFPEPVRFGGKGLRGPRVHGVYGWLFLVIRRLLRIFSCLIPGRVLAFDGPEERWQHLGFKLKDDDFQKFRHNFLKLALKFNKDIYRNLGRNWFPGANLIVLSPSDILLYCVQSNISIPISVCDLLTDLLSSGWNATRICLCLHCLNLFSLNNSVKVGVKYCDFLNNYKLILVSSRLIQYNLLPKIHCIFSIF